MNLTQIKNAASLARIIYLIKTKRISQLALHATDFSGKRKTLTITANNFLQEKVWKRIQGIDGSNYGFRKTTRSDMGLKINVRTGFIDPFCEIPTLSFLCSIKEANGNDFALDPRTILKKAQAHLASFIDGNFICAPELEFYLRELDPHERAKIKQWFPELPTYYHLSPPYDLYFHLRSEMVNHMLRLGMPIKYHHTEAGGTRDGTQQQEIEFLFAPPLLTADNYFFARYIVEHCAAKHGKSTTFDPKPFEKLAGNGLHTHMYISKHGKSLFYSPNPPYHLSGFALKFMGGVLKHAQALAAFTDPTPESYQRLDPEQEAPRDIFFGPLDRTASVRIPGYSLNPEGARFEYRPTDASGNYYLALAAIIMAGLDGIRSQSSPIKESFLPDYNGERDKLPTSTNEAASALKEDHAFLLNGGIFPEEAIELQIRMLGSNYEN